MFKQTIAIAALCCATVGCEFPTESKKPVVHTLFENCPDIIFSCSLMNPEVNGAGALIDELENAIAKVDKNNVGAAINQLQTFIQRIEALVQAGTFTQPDGELLTTVVQSAIDELSS